MRIQVSSSKYFVYILIAIAVLLRIYMLHAKGLWVDEAYSVHLASLDFKTLIHKLSLESTPPLYYLALKVCIKLFGISEMSVRLLSVISSIASVLMLFILVKNAVSKHVALWTTTLYAMCPISILYAQEARMYALLVLLSILLIYLFHKDYNAHSWRTSVGIPIVSVLIMLTHTVGIMFVAAVYVSCVLLHKQKERVVRLGVVSAVLFLPWFFVLMKQVSAQGTILSWFVPFWFSKPVFLHIWEIFSHALAGPFLPYVGMENTVLFAHIFTLTLVILACYGTVTLWDYLCVRLSVSIFAFALIFLIVYSYLFQPILIPGRTEHFLVPLFYILIGCGIASVPRKVYQIMLVCLFVLFSGLTLQAYYTTELKNTSRRCLEEINPTIKPGDIIVATGLNYMVVEYYVNLWGLENEVKAFPPEVADHPGYIDFSKYDVHNIEMKNMTEQFVQSIKRRAKEDNVRVFLIMSAQEINKELLLYIRRVFPHEREVVGAFRQSLIRIPIKVYTFD